MPQRSHQRMNLSYSRAVFATGQVIVAVVPSQPFWRQVTLICSFGTVFVSTAANPFNDGFQMGIAGTFPSTVQFWVPPDTEMYGASSTANSMLTSIITAFPDEMMGAALQIGR